MYPHSPQAAGQRGSVQDAEARAEAREPRPGGHGPEDEAAPAGARGRGHGALHPPGPHTPPPLHQDRGHPAPAPSQGEQCCYGAQHATCNHATAQYKILCVLMSLFSERDRKGSF